MPIRPAPYRSKRPPSSDLRPITESFNISLPRGYCQVTQIAQPAISRNYPVNYQVPSLELVDTKFTVITLEKLQVIAGSVTAERVLDGPRRVPKDYSLRALHLNHEDTLQEPMEQLDRCLSSLEERLPDAPRQQIVRGFRRFLTAAINRAKSLHLCAVWTSLTVELVKKADYDEQNATHRHMIMNRQDPNTGEIMRCSGCGLELYPSNNLYMRMPCGDYCHTYCIWRWPCSV